MKRYLTIGATSLAMCLVIGHDVDGRGFGGYRGGGFSGGMSRGYGGGFSSFAGADRYGGSYSGSRSFSSSAGLDRSASGSYDRTWSDARGGSINTSGERGAYRGPYGGFAAGGSRDTSLTTAGGRTFSADRIGGVASGPLGRTVGSAAGSLDGRYGTSSWHTAFSGNRYTGNMNHYASVYGANGRHSTAYWSTGYMHVHAGYIRHGFGYYHCFRPDWYLRHPGCWIAAGWAAEAAWIAISYAEMVSYCGLDGTTQPDYDYGNTVAYQGDDVYMNGQSVGTTQQFAQQASDIASQGQAVNPPPTADWKAIGVYALVQGDEKTSNNIFQLAVNKDGIIRGNYYDGLTDTTTEVYGSVDKKTQRAAWTIGKKKDRVFEAGVLNLTQPQCPCLVHLGTQKSDQMLLVRVEQPKDGK